MNTNELGIFGEKTAKRYLEDRGYRVLDANYCFRAPHGPQKAEIDIIAKKYDVISFVEVKTLQNTGWSRIISPGDKVDFAKRKKIIKAAEHWLNKNKMPLDSKWQIDVVAITINSSGEKVQIRHFENVASY